MMPVSKFPRTSPAAPRTSQLSPRTVDFTQAFFPRLFFITLFEPLFPGTSELRFVNFLFDGCPSVPPAGSSFFWSPALNIYPRVFCCRIFNAGAPPRFCFLLILRKSPRDFFFFPPPFSGCDPFSAVPPWCLFLLRFPMLPLNLFSGDLFPPLFASKTGSTMGIFCFPCPVFLLAPFFF